MSVWPKLFTLALLILDLCGIGACVYATAHTGDTVWVRLAVVLGFGALILLAFVRNDF